ncbi:hypothetical protein CQW23_05987 [Capsicum baccatum]|uniref:Uncharacterized protein n=1 Tax=Capsicum baccatum TaxID=33114 RepID=A0A2G2X219_CAPBA|nr:hypothetical protein CQW23_05987 [Capsicum baccatum]
MITFIASIDQNIIIEDYDEHVQVLFEHMVHQVHESGWGIAEPEVYLREVDGTLNLVKQVIDYGRRALVLGSDLIELTIINAYFEKTIFLCTNKTGAPHRDTLGLINPLSKRSFNYSFNSLSFSGATQYGRIDVGCVSRRRSIPNSISLSRGISGKSSGKTSEYSFTIGTDSRLEVLELVSLT